MSRIGKAPVELPGGVNAEISGRSVKVTGPRGELTVPVGRGVEVRQEDGSLVLERASDAPEHKAMHGLTRSLIQNAVTGVTEGFSKTLQIAGEIRKVRPPEPYKGKGIRYSDEQIRRKVGKAG